MRWHALDALDDALEATKGLLLPFSAKRWLTLAVVAFFVSGATSANPSTGIGVPDLSVSSTTAPVAPADGFPEPIREPIVFNGVFEPFPESPVGDVAPALGGIELLIVLAVVGLVGVLGILFLYLGAVMEFVFVKIAVETDVRIRGFFGESTGKGFSLFVFRIAIGLVVLGTVLASVVLTVLTGGLFAIVLLLASPLFVLFAVGLWILLRFTTDFVVPVMIAADVGLIEGWRRLWPELQTEWKQYGAYAVARFLLGIVAGIVLAVGIAAVVVALLIPFGIVGLAGGALLAAIGTELALMVFLAGLAILFALSIVAATLVFLQVPVQTYLRYYALFVLGGISPSYDLVADLRPSASDS